MLNRILLGGLTACAIALPVAAQDAYLVESDRRADRTAIKHLRTRGRCLAHLYR